MSKFVDAARGSQPNVTFQILKADLNRAVRWLDRADSRSQDRQDRGVARAAACPASRARARCLNRSIALPNSLDYVDGGVRLVEPDHILGRGLVERLDREA